MSKKEFLLLVWGGIALPCFLMLPVMLFGILVGIESSFWNMDGGESLYTVGFFFAGLGGLIAFIGVIKGLLLIRKKEVLPIELLAMAWIGRVAALVALIILPLPLFFLSIGSPLLCSFFVFHAYNEQLND